ncbi:hypothetical protein GCM10009534_56470 [Kribbella sandramycini]
MPDTPASWRLEPIELFESSDWDMLESRGILMGVQLVHGDRSFPVVLYDHVRIAQDAEVETLSPDPYYEANVIIVRNLTKETAEAAVARLGELGAFDWMLK